MGAALDDSLGHGHPHHPRAMRTEADTEAGLLPKVTQQVSLARGVNHSLAASASSYHGGMGVGSGLASG